MRLYFEAPNGDRLAIDTKKEIYSTNFEDGAGDVPDGHRYIWLESGKDLDIILSEIEFCGWSYDDTWTGDTNDDPQLRAADRFWRGPRTAGADPKEPRTFE